MNSSNQNKSNDPNAERLNILITSGEDSNEDLIWVFLESETLSKSFLQWCSDDKQIHGEKSDDLEIKYEKLGFTKELELVKTEKESLKQQLEKSEKENEYNKKLLLLCYLWKILTSLIKTSFDKCVFE